MWLFWFAAGAIAGSAANALIYRLPRSISWAHGRSICPKCKHELAWYDLIPLLSFAMLGGRCRYCGKNIGWRYFLVELLLGMSFVVILGHTLSYSSLVLAGIFWVTVIIAVMDWEARLVSEKMILIWGALVAVSQFSSFPVVQLSWSSSLVGLVVAVGLIGGIWAVSWGKAMGFGDVEIAAVIGWWLGWPGIAPALWISFVSGALVGLWFMVYRKMKMKSEMAFGPFLILGAWIGYFWGGKIWAWVFRF